MPFVQALNGQYPCHSTSIVWSNSRYFIAALTSGSVAMAVAGGLRRSCGREKLDKVGETINKMIYGYRKTPMLPRVKVTQEFKDSRTGEC